MSQRVGRDPGRRLHSRTTEGMGLKAEWKVRVMQVALGPEKALSRLRTMRAKLSRKSPT